MAEQAKPSADAVAEAAHLFAEAQAAFDRQDFARARACYQRSLALHEDETVRAAYRKFMAMYGPM